jgi:hypothetical protein
MICNAHHNKAHLVPTTGLLVPDEEPSALQQQHATNSSRKQRAAGETSTHVQSDLGTSMALRFEVFIVKIPLLSLHGIQFKKVDGGTWQYKNMAQTIIRELNL